MKRASEFTKQIIAMKIILFIVLNVDLEILTLLFSSFVFLFSFSTFIYFYHIFFLSLGVYDPKLTNPKLGDRLQLWPVLPPAT